MPEGGATCISPQGKAIAHPLIWEIFNIVKFTNWPMVWLHASLHVDLLQSAGFILKLLNFELFLNQALGAVVVRVSWGQSFGQTLCAQKACRAEATHAGWGKPRRAGRKSSFSRRGKAQQELVWNWMHKVLKSYCRESGLWGSQPAQTGVRTPLG
jgi:hypothetical protein